MNRTHDEPERGLSGLDVTLAAVYSLAFIGPSFLLARLATRDTGSARPGLGAALSALFSSDLARWRIMRRLRRLMGRAAMTEREVALLRGMARQILWAADRAGLSVVPDRDE